jgi:hypothetical protein
MLSDYTGGPASPLGMAVKLGVMCCEIVYHKTIVIQYQYRHKRLMEKVVARRLPSKRLHISGDYYVH